MISGPFFLLRSPRHAGSGRLCCGCGLATKPGIGHFPGQSRLITLLVNGEPQSAKLILRDLVNATVGFEALTHEIHKPAKRLHRMLSKSGNPTMTNVSAIFAAIERALKVEVRAQVVMA